MTDELKCIFLGTGAATPSLTRGLPSVAIVKDGWIYLCDCGEGTQFKLMQAGLSPTKIRYIFISHLHGDHIFGFPGYLNSQQLYGRTTPLTLYGPPGISAFYRSVAQLSKYKVDYPLDIVELDPEQMHELDCTAIKIKASSLEHSVPCFGYRFEEAPKVGKFDNDKANVLGIPNGPERAGLQRGESVRIGDRLVHSAEVVGDPIPGRIITYCTDTRPCETTRQLAEDADLLIHDSTFSDAYSDRAEATCHSTSREAAQMARDAGAQQLALFHISIRIQKEEESRLLQQAREVFENTLLPDDLAGIMLRRRTS